MPLKIVFKTDEGDRLACPVIICDVCRKEITDAGKGNYLYKREYGGVEGVEEEIYFVHKGDCDDFLSEKLKDKKSKPGYYYGWEDLSRLCLLLSRNCEGMKSLDNGK